MTRAEAYSELYEEGHLQGTEWAENDRRDHMPASEGVTLLREEAQSDQRWARAFYLGALRGYRSVARSKLGGRWGL